MVSAQYRLPHIFYWLQRFCVTHQQKKSIRQTYLPDNHTQDFNSLLLGHFVEVTFYHCPWSWTTVRKLSETFTCCKGWSLWVVALWPVFWLFDFLKVAQRRTVKYISLTFDSFRSLLAPCSSSRLLLCCFDVSTWICNVSYSTWRSLTFVCQHNYYLSVLCTKTSPPVCKGAEYFLLSSLPSSLCSSHFFFIQQLPVKNKHIPFLPVVRFIWWSNNPFSHSLCFSFCKKEWGA